MSTDYDPIPDIVDALVDAFESELGEGTVKRFGDEIVQYITIPREPLNGEDLVSFIANTVHLATGEKPTIVPRTDMYPEIESAGTRTTIDTRGHTARMSKGARLFIELVRTHDRSRR